LSAVCKPLIVTKLIRIIYTLDEEESGVVAIRVRYVRESLYTIRQALMEEE
jgi:hypothetical protein